MTIYADPEFTHATQRAIAKIAGEDTRKMPSFMSGCDKDLPLEGEYFDTATAKLYLDALDGRSAKQVGDFEMPTCPTCRAQLGVSILKAEAQRT
jgi:hypothetical protein